MNIKNKSFMALALGGIIAIGSSVNIFAAGTDRAWATPLPHGNRNAYFAKRNKETREAFAKFRLLSHSNDGKVNAWVDNGEGKRLTEVRKMSVSTSFKDLGYFAGCNNKGQNVRLGVENDASTKWFKDNASGTINYK